MGSSIQRNRLILVYGSALVLLLAAALKTSSLTHGDKILNELDGVVGWSNRQLYVVAALLESLAVVYLFLGRNLHAKLALIAWMGWVFSFYHIASYFYNFPAPCACLGQLTVFPVWVQNDTRPIPIVMALGMAGSGSFFLAFPQSRQPSA